MRGPASKLEARARRWWPVPVVLASSLTVQKLLFEGRYHVSGHAAGHLSSATALFLALALVAILLWTTPTGRRQPDVPVACLAWLAATVLVLVGNVRVVDALVDAGLGRARTADVLDIADHGLTNLAPWLAVAAAVVMAGVLWRRGHVSRRVAVGAGLLSVVFPPWIIPGAGVLVLVVARCVAYGRLSTVASRETPRPAT
ncbi:MAG: hypothetical protein ABWZ76_02225 [Acidimicrobiales bacterium]